VVYVPTWEGEVSKVARIDYNNLVSFLWRKQQG
jgi:hypothetical protein